MSSFSNKTPLFQRSLKKAAFGGLFSFLVTVAFLGLPSLLHFSQLFLLGLGIGFIASGLIFFVHSAEVVRVGLKGTISDYIVLFGLLGIGILVLLSLSSTKIFFNYLFVRYLCSLDLYCSLMEFFYSFG